MMTKMAFTIAFASLALTLPHLLVAQVTEQGVQVEQVVVQFDPVALLLVVEETSHEVRWWTNTTMPVNTIVAAMTDSLVAVVDEWSEVEEGNEGDNYTYSGTVNVTATFIGYNNLNVTLLDTDNNTIGRGIMKMTVILKAQQANDIFTLAIAVLVGILYLFMGATLDLQVVKRIVKKPIGPAVGLFCQYVLMPLISFGLGLVLFPDDELLRLGLFLNGSCPGGGASNMWTHLLGGSLDLSIMMTAVSTVFAFVSVPFWVLVLGPVILADADFSIPFVDIVVTVVSLIIPCCLGVAIQIFFPKTVKYFEKLLTPMSAFNLLFTFTFGIYAYLYVFTIFTWRMLVSGIVLPSLGYMAGMVFAFLFRMTPREVIAISVETGVQNYTIGLIILAVTLESPAGQLAAAVPAAATLFTPAPLVVLLLAKKLYDRRHREASVEISDLKEIPPAVKNGDTTKDMVGAKDEDTKGVEGVVANGVDNPGLDLQSETA